MQSKITTGFVIQVFDESKKRFVSQTFIAGDEVDYETEDGEVLKDTKDIKNAYLPFDMVQPELSDEV